VANCINVSLSNQAHASILQSKHIPGFGYSVRLIRELFIYSREQKTMYQVISPITGTVVRELTNRTRAYKLAETLGPDYTVRIKP
jgi:hypothetical protein